MLRCLRISLPNFVLSILKFIIIFIKSNVYLLVCDGRKWVNCEGLKAQSHLKEITKEQNVIVVAHGKTKLCYVS